jgi:hypothetical protein
LIRSDLIFAARGGYKGGNLLGGFSVKTAPHQQDKIKSQLHSAKQQIKNLRRDLKKLQTPKLDQIEVSLLQCIADCDMDDAFEVTFAEVLKLSKPQLDFHLTRLLKAHCIEILFTDPLLGENFAITQKGREVLFRPQSSRNN